MILEGVIQKNATVLGDDGEIYNLPVRGTDHEGYSEVLIDAKNVEGDGWMCRQSIKPYLGMRVRFCCNTKPPYGYNYEIIEKEVKK